MPHAGSSTTSPGLGSTRYNHESNDGAGRVELAGVAGHVSRSRSIDS